MGNSFALYRKRAATRPDHRHHVYTGLSLCLILIPALRMQAQAVALASSTANVQQQMTLDVSEGAP